MREYTSTPPAAPADAEEPEEFPLAHIRFTLDGVSFACLGAANLLELSDLADAADAAEMAPDSPAGRALMGRFMRTAFGPEEYRRLRTHFTARKTKVAVQMQIINDIVAELEDLVEAEAGRPTGQRSPSSGGRVAPAGRVSKLTSLAELGDVVVLPPGGQAPEGPPARKSLSPKQPADRKAAGGTRRASPRRRATG